MPSHSTFNFRGEVRDCDWLWTWTHIYRLKDHMCWNLLAAQYSHSNMVLIASLGSPILQPKRRMALTISLLAIADMYLSWSSLDRIQPDKHHLEELQPQGISVTGLPRPKHHWSSCWGKPRQPAMELMALIGTSGLALWIYTKLVYLSIVLLCCGNTLQYMRDGWHSKTPQFKLTVFLFFPVRLYRSLSFEAADPKTQFRARRRWEFRCPPPCWAHQQCWGGMCKTPTTLRRRPARPWPGSTQQKWSEHLRTAGAKWQIGIKAAKYGWNSFSQSRQPFPTKGIFLLCPVGSFLWNAIYVNYPAIMEVYSWDNDL